MNSTLTSKTKLLPCPFCGSAPLMAEARNAGGWWLITCGGDDCGTSPNLECEGREKAIVRWNKRHTPPETSEGPVIQHVYTRGGRAAVTGIPGPDHNCDAMGCSSLEHVIVRVPHTTDESPEPQTVTEKDAARYEFLREHWRWIVSHTSCSPSGRHVDLIEVNRQLGQDIDPQSLDQAIDAAIRIEAERG
jgi:hypothetical protein